MKYYLDSVIIRGRTLVKDWLGHWCLLSKDGKKVVYQWSGYSLAQTFVLAHRYIKDHENT